MKSEFQFFYKADRIVFAEEYSTSWHISASPDKSGHEEGPIHLDIDIKIKPKVEANDSESELHGELLITLPGKPEDLSGLVIRIANDISEHISFFCDEFTLFGGMISARRIPENREEEKLIRGGEYWVEMNVTEVPIPIDFDIRVLKAFPAYQPLRRAIVQFNSARKAGNPIDHYLGMFKVLECLFHNGQGFDTLHTETRLRETLKIYCRNNDGSELSESEITELIKHLVKYRNRCAHLRERENYGLVVFDEDTQNKVRPSAELLETTMRRAIFDHMTSRSSLPDGLELAPRPVGLLPK